jgi:peptide/nickel transport system substrate-binding protein
LAPLVLIASVVLSACAEGPGHQDLQVLAPDLPSRLDPYVDPRHLSENVFINIFEPLVVTAATEHIRPALAESWTNPDPNAYVFNLRPGVVFHDGAPLDAVAVARSFERARQGRQFAAGALAEVTAIEVRGPLTLELRTARPLLDLVFKLGSLPVTRPGPSPDAQVGTGPFEVVEFTPGESVRLRRFERHYRPRPYLREVRFRRFADADGARRLLEADPNTLVLAPPSDLLSLGPLARDFDLWTGPASTGVYLAFGLRQGNGEARPFHDLRIRQAVNLALDRDALLPAGAPLGAGTTSNQHVPTGVLGFDPSLPPLVRDARRARALLAEAGYPKGFQTTLDATPAYRNVASLVASQLAEVGLRVQVSYLKPEPFLAHIEQQSEFYLHSWVQGDDAAEFLHSFLHTKDPARGHGLRNRTGYSNPRVDRLIDGALITLSPRERVGLLREAMGLVMRDLPWVPLYCPHIARIYPRTLSVPKASDSLLRLAECRPRR